MSTDPFISKNIVVLSCSRNLDETLKTYIQIHPPEMNRFKYIGIWETVADSDEELFGQLQIFQNKFYRYRLMKERKGDCEWFDFQRGKIYSQVKEFLDTCPFIKREIPLKNLKHLIS